MVTNLILFRYKRVGFFYNHKINICKPFRNHRLSYSLLIVNIGWQLFCKPSCLVLQNSKQNKIVLVARPDGSLTSSKSLHLRHSRLQHSTQVPSSRVSCSLSISCLSDGTPRTGLPDGIGDGTPKTGLPGSSRASPSPVSSPPPDVGDMEEMGER